MNDLVDKLDLFLEAKTALVSNYRKSLYSSIVFDSYHKQTERGHVIKIKMYRKDFYKPRNYDAKQEGFFGLDQLLRDMQMDHLVNTVEDKYRHFMKCFADIFKTGFVIHHYPIKEIVSLQYVSEEQLNYLKENITIIPGHIRAIRYSKPQYEGHKPLEVNGKLFYYRTEWTPTFKPDIDMTKGKKFKEDELIAQGDLTVVTKPEPVIIGE